MSTGCICVLLNLLHYFSAMSDELTKLLDTAAIFRYHQLLTQKHGSGTTGSLGWLQQEGQQARFDMLSRIANFNNLSVLDAGCGHADLFPFLKKLYPAMRYFGLEQVPQLLEVGFERYKAEEDATFLLGDFMQAGLPTTDYVLACGSLSYRHQDEAFIYKAIETLFACCRLGLGFNLLSGGIPPDSLLVVYSPEEIHRFCKTLSPKTELHQGYLENDFTLFMCH